VHRSLYLVREKAMKHGISLLTDIAPDLPLVEADERRLRQVLVNLLSNAVKFTPDGGEIRVGVCLSAAMGKGRQRAASSPMLHHHRGRHRPRIAERTGCFFFVQLDSSLQKQRASWNQQAHRDQHRGRIFAASNRAAAASSASSCRCARRRRWPQLSRFSALADFVQHRPGVTSRRLGSSCRLLRLEMMRRRIELAGGSQSFCRKNQGAKVIAGTADLGSCFLFSGRTQPDGAAVEMLAGWGLPPPSSGRISRGWGHVGV
jgi:hypothetical protein